MDKTIKEAWKNTNLDLNRLFDEQRRIEKQLKAIRNALDYHFSQDKNKKTMNDLIKIEKLLKEMNNG